MVLYTHREYLDEMDLEEIANDLIFMQKIPEIKFLPNLPNKQNLRHYVASYYCNHLCLILIIVVVACASY